MLRSPKEMLDGKLSVASSSSVLTFDSVSEISEVASLSTRGSSIYGDTREELHELAVRLGFADASDLHQERFRVDRRKLENMLLGADQSDGTAATFFKKIMEETTTFIIWPARLKIGSKSKNDPHVRIAGRPDDVKEAKDKVLAALDVRNNRVTLKLNVSYTDHSHIIGKGGLTIKRVMEQTGCHIHFPDSNRSNPMEKSNQVSIAGEMACVERARARVRELSPLMFSFELPIVGSLQPHLDQESPFLTSIQEKYNVQVMFRNRPKLHATLVIIKGCEWEVNQVKEATRILINRMCDSLASQVVVQMSMEIAAQHHPILLGKSSANLKLIMQRTKTQILFPDAGDPNIPSIKKSNVVITGPINNVYLARQQLLGSLPLVLMFDVPEESMTVGSDEATHLMHTLDLMITIRHKPKQNTMSVIIKGIERNATNIYEARKRLLGLQEAAIKADIPPTYQLIDGPPLFDSANAGNMCPVNSILLASPGGMTGGFPLSPLAHLQSPSSLASTMSPNLSPGVMSPALSPGVSPALSPALSPGVSPGVSPSVSPSVLSAANLPWGQSFGLLSPGPHSPHSPHSPLSPHLSHLLAQNSHQHHQQSPRQNVQQQQQRNQHQIFLQQWVPWMQHLTMTQPTQPQPQPQQSPGQNVAKPAPCGLNGIGTDLGNFQLGDRVGSHSSHSSHGSTCSLGYHINTSSSQSRYSGSSHSLERPFSSVSCTASCVSSPAVSPRLTSPQHGVSNSAKSPKLDVSGANDEGRNFSAKMIFQQKMTPIDHQQKRTQAAKAVRAKLSLSTLRMPTNYWSGHGLSSSSPSAILKGQFKSEPGSRDAHDDGTWRAPTNEDAPAICFSANVESGEGEGERERESPPVPFSASSYLDSLPSTTVASIVGSESTNAKDLPSLLISIGMEKYIHVFEEHEVDMKVFMSLTDKDLKDIGVVTFGARRAMLLAIAQQKRVQSPFRGSAAPGAERKCSSTALKGRNLNDSW